MESSSGRQLNFAALNRGRHLCSAGRPSGWALAHILVAVYFDFDFEPLNDAAQSSMHNSSAAVDSQTIIGIATICSAFYAMAPCPLSMRLTLLMTLSDTDNPKSP